MSCLSCLVLALTSSYITSMHIHLLSARLSHTLSLLDAPPPIAPPPPPEAFLLLHLAHCQLPTGGRVSPTHP